MANAMTISHGSLPVISSGSLDAYIHGTMQIPVLDAAEEKSLALRFVEQNDLDAARKLITHHLRFVVKVARGYSGYGLALGDLIQEGNIGLMKAVKRFDPSLEVRLVSFAVHWIRAEIHEFILRNWRIVKIATTKAQRKLFFNLRSTKKRLGWMNQSEADSIAADLGVSTKDVMEMESRLSGLDVSYDGLQTDDADDGPVVTPSAYLADAGADPAEMLESDDLESHQTMQLSTALGELDERSRDIIEARWLTENKSTLHELASRYNISAERVRQLESNALKKLRGQLGTI